MSSEAEAGRGGGGGGEGRGYYLGPAAWGALTQDDVDRHVIARLEELHVAARGTDDEAVIARALAVLRAYGPLVHEVLRLRARRSWWRRLWGGGEEA